MERLLKPDEAAKLLGLSSGTLAKLRVYGGGPTFRKLGRAIRYDTADLQAWSDERARSSTSETDEAAIEKIFFEELAARKRR